MFDESVVLKVSVRNRFDEHNSVDEAIDSARKERLLANTRRANQQLAGKVVEAVAWSDSSARLSFIGGVSLCVTGTDIGIACAVESTARPDAVPPHHPRRLLLQYDLSPTTVVWERARVLEQRIGHAFDGIVRSGRSEFLYVRGCPILLFVVLRVDDPEGGKSLLSWDDAG